MTHIRLTYGLEPHDIALLWDRQVGLCALCSLPLDDSVSIDHDHSTERVRGLLHRACNGLLGLIESVGFPALNDRLTAYLSTAA